MVPASAHVKDVYLGGNGVLEGLANLGKREAQDTLCIDESTIEQSESRKVAQAIKSTGAEMIDAPVSGGTDGVLQKEIPHELADSLQEQWAQETVH